MTPDTTRSHTAHPTSNNLPTSKGGAATQNAPRDPQGEPAIRWDFVGTTGLEPGTSTVSW